MEQAQDALLFDDIVHRIHHTKPSSTVLLVVGIACLKQDLHTIQWRNGCLCLLFHVSLSCLWLHACTAHLGHVCRHTYCTSCDATSKSTPQNIVPAVPVSLGHLLSRGPLHVYVHTSHTQRPTSLMHLVWGTIRITQVTSQTNRVWATKAGRHLRYVLVCG